MQRSGEGRVFTAEVQRRRKLDPEGASHGVNMADVMVAIQSLRVDVASLGERFDAGLEAVKKADAPEGEPIPGTPEAQEVIDRHQRELAEVRVLKIELNALAHSIETTKKEIALLRAESEDGDRLSTVANELDAVVDATEGATDTILDNVEKIAGLASQIQAQEQDSYLRHVADEIQELTVNVFEACNFQDLTGQRITKVVNTMKFIEQRVDRMMEIWGRDTFNELPVESEEEKQRGHDDEARLLNGPQDTGKGISQDEIDRLFD